MVWVLAQAADNATRKGGESEGPSVIWMFMLVVGAMLIVLTLPRVFGRKKSSSEPAPVRTFDPKRHLELQGSMDRLLVELQETAREINASLDTKMIALNRLIEEADRKIKTLQDLEGRAPAPAPPAPKDVSPPPVSPPPRETEEPLSESALRRRELEREIGRLADEGKTVLEIAQLTRTPRGEVELVLSLRKAQGEGKT